MARDQNYVPNAYGVSSASSTTPLAIAVDPVSGRVLCKVVGASGTAIGTPRVAPRDQNGVPARMGEDESGLPLAIRINESNNGVMMKAD